MAMIRQKPQVVGKQNIFAGGSTSNAPLLREIGNELGRSTDEFYSTYLTKEANLGTEEGNAIILDDIVTIDASTGRPKAFSGIEVWSKAKTDAYRSVVQQRFSNAIKDQFKNYSLDLIQKTRFNDDRVKDYTDGMENYLSEKLKYSEDGFYKNKIKEHYSQIVQNHKIAIDGEIQETLRADLAKQYEVERTEDAYDVIAFGYSGGSIDNLMEMLVSKKGNDADYLNLGVTTKFRQIQHEKDLIQKYIVSSIGHLLKEFDISKESSSVLYRALLDKNKLYSLPRVFKKRNGSLARANQSLELREKVESFHKLFQKNDINPMAIQKSLQVILGSGEEEESSEPQKLSNHERLYWSYVGDFFELGENGQIKTDTEGFPVIKIQDTSEGPLSEKQSIESVAGLNINGIPAKYVNGVLVPKPEDEWGVRDKLTYKAFRTYQRKALEIARDFESELLKNVDMFNPWYMATIDRVWDANSDTLNLPKIQSRAEFLSAMTHFLYDPRNKEKQFLVPDDLKGGFTETQVVKSRYVNAKKLLFEIAQNKNSASNFIEYAKTYFDNYRKLITARTEVIKTVLKKQKEEIAKQTKILNINIGDSIEDTMNGVYNTMPKTIESYKEIEKYFGELIAQQQLENPDGFLEWNNTLQTFIEGKRDWFLGEMVKEALNTSFSWTADSYTLDPTGKKTIGEVRTFDYNHHNLGERAIVGEAVTETILGTADVKDRIDFINSKAPNIAETVKFVRDKIRKQSVLNKVVTDIEKDIEGDIKLIEENNERIEIQNKANTVRKLVNTDNGSGVLAETIISSDKKVLSRLKEQFDEIVSRYGVLGLLSGDGYELAKTLLSLDEMPESITNSLNGIISGNPPKEADLIPLLNFFQVFSSVPFETKKGGFAYKNYMLQNIGAETYGDLQGLIGYFKVQGYGNADKVIADLANMKKRGANKLEVDPTKYDAAVEKLINANFEGKDFVAKETFAHVLKVYLSRDISEEDAIKGVKQYEKEVLVPDYGFMYDPSLGIGNTTNSPYSLNSITRDIELQHMLLTDVFLKDYLTEVSFDVTEPYSELRAEFYREPRAGGKYEELRLMEQRHLIEMRDSARTPVTRKIQGHVYIEDGVKYNLVMGDDLWSDNQYNSMLKEGNFLFRDNIPELGEIQDKRIWLQPLLDTNTVNDALAQVPLLPDSPLAKVYKTFQNHVEYIVVTRGSNGEIIPFTPKGELIVRTYAELNGTLKTIAQEEWDDSVERGDWDTRNLYADDLTDGIDTMLQTPYLGSKLLGGIDIWGKIMDNQIKLFGIELGQEKPLEID